MTGKSTHSERESLFQLAFSHGVPRRSLIVAIVVGTVLNLINQGDVLWGGASVDGLKLALTYAVPYCVATYGAVTARRYILERGGSPG